MKKIILIILIIGMIGLVSAANGLCFDPDTGLCTDGVEQSQCTSEGGEFGNNDKCTQGCCALGNNFLFYTGRTCELASRGSYSYPENFQYTDEESCYALTRSSAEGACLLGGEYEQDCKYTTFDQCPTQDFYEGVSCTESSLNTICTSTSDTICYNEDVYTRDSCSNPDQLIRSCNYESGSICKRENSKKAVCQDLNCVDGEGNKRKNGERWCITESNLTGSAAGESEGCGRHGCDECQFTYKSYEGTWRVRLPTGTSANTGGITVDGKKFSYRGQDTDCGCSRPSYTGKFGPSEFSGGSYEISPGGFSLSPTGWQSCGSSGSSSGGPGSSSVACEKQDGGDSSDFWDCNNMGVYDTQAACEAATSCGSSGSSSGGPGSSSSSSGGSTDSLFGEGTPGTINAPVGSRFFTKYCLNGEIYDEPCGEFRMEYCGEHAADDGEILLEDTQGECEINPWQECFTVNSDLNKETFDLEKFKKDCNPDYCAVFRPLDCVTFADPSTSTGESEQYCGAERTAWPQTAQDNGLDPATVKEVASDLLKGLKLEMCLPKLPGGFPFYPKEGSFTTGGSVCDQGDYTIKAGILQDQATHFWPFSFGKDCTEFGGIGMFSSDIAGTPFSREALGNCDTNDDIIDNNPRWPLQVGYYLNQKPNKKVEELLNARCNAIGDCAGKLNWVKVEGGEYETITHAEKKEYPSGHTVFTYTYDFDCEPWRAPSGSDDCKLCGTDDLPCSEYRCRALGKACKYSEPAGSESGYCVSSSDRTPASISVSMNPSSPVPPFTPVTINVETSEVTSCRFNIGDSEGTYDDMKHEFGSDWGTEHKVRLNLPGQVEGNDEITEYDLIQRDGKYEMFIRCIDTAGNFNIAAKLISFEVMDTPDTVPPIIMTTSFVPASGSAIKYNTTSKEIEFKINEPAECKWSKDDKSYENMENEFNCDSSISDRGVLDGYGCEGTLTKVTNETTEQTNYFIRCKDQAWLDTNNPNPGFYSRNVNQKSYEYSLTASTPLIIFAMTPEGRAIKTSSDTSVPITAVTTGGGSNGKAECRWKLEGDCLGGSSSYKLFSKTNVKSHEDTSVNLSEGPCNLSVKCEDESENKVEKSNLFSLLIDNTSPKISRAYHFTGKLIIHTNEESECRYTTDKKINCAFDFDGPNITLMSGASYRHEADWLEDTKYYIKCRDYKDNTNPGCGIITRTY